MDYLFFVSSSKMSFIAICTASVLLLYLNRIRDISLNVRSDIPLLVRYVCANDKVVSICEKWPYADNFS